MQLVDGALVFSPSDLHHFLECRHLTSLLASVARRERERPKQDDASIELLRRRGLDHETTWLEKQRAAGLSVIEVPGPRESGSWTASADATAVAMRGGAAIIYQGVLVGDGWRGIADFLMRVEEPSALGGWSYEACDTKLALQSKPYYLLQLAYYTEQVARIQRRTPRRMHVVLGSGEMETFRTADVDAYFRWLRARFGEFVNDPPPTLPYPIGHCAFCGFKAACEERWRVEDHLSLVAQIRREQVTRLQDAGITSVAALAAASPDALDVRIGTRTLASLIAQARLQDAARRTGQHRYELLPPEDERGFRLLPQPSAGDLFFDMEGYPYFEAAKGLEYLFGVVHQENGEPRFTAFRAHNREEEKAAFEAFIDFAWARLVADPQLHIYHYSGYETTAVRRLAQEHGTRIEEVDELLRREVFVDLYRVVRQTLRISHESYGLKSVRTFFMPEAGQGIVADAAESIVEFDRWMRTGDASILNAIARYNEEDCISTLKLRDWLLERRKEAIEQFGVELPWREPPKRAQREVALEPDENAGLRAALLAAGGEGERYSRELLAHLLDFHRREAKPEWWAYFDRREKSLDELLEDGEAIAGMSLAADAPRVRAKQSWIYTFTYPEQEHKLGPGDTVEDPRTGSGWKIHSIDTAERRLTLKTKADFTEATAPRSLVAGGPIDTKAQREAVRRLAEHVANTGLEGRGPFQATRGLLQRRLPRLKGIESGAAIQTIDLETLKERVASLDDSYLFIQGPPGSGKTWNGARLIAHLIDKCGKRVGISALSHKAIHKMLEEVEKVAVTEGLNLRGLKKASDDRPDSFFDGRLVQNTIENKDCTDPDYRLIVGTSFLFARPEMQETLDYLFIDEAGQIALGDAIAMAPCARNLVLLGDPQQLPNVMQMDHPDGVGVSVLQHLLGDRATVPLHEGIFLSRTWRLHPDVCTFVSELAYDGRLESDASCARQNIRSAGISDTGIHYLPVTHDGNTQQSIEEADRIAREVRTLLETGEFTDADGATRRCRPSDILVVAPYNMQVRCLRERLPDGVDCGTVHKFQGREAAVVFFSMATSSGADIPRNLEFLFNRNSLNVAISRARAAAVVVSSPRLLEAPCRRVDQMTLLNMFCRLIEVAKTG